MAQSHLTEPTEPLSSLKTNVWLFGAAALVVGIVDRIIASFADGRLSANELKQLLIITFFFASWFSLKPKAKLH